MHKMSFYCPCLLNERTVSKERVEVIQPRLKGERADDNCFVVRSLMRVIKHVGEVDIMDKVGGALLRKISSGSTQAFDQFYEIYFQYVYQMALQMTKNTCEAEDLCHDVFVDVFRHARQFDSDRGSVRAWLAIMIKSRYIDRLRKTKRSQDYIESLNLTDREPAIDEVVLQHMDRERVLKAMRQLPDIQKKAVYGKYFKYHTQKELATIMDKPIGTIKSLIRYGLSNLRKQLLKED